ncbi:hypothetical protein C723_1127 [Christiangramia flava JLT2011]|nr:hypothetical protein C723_1127 [Christiangramia flava JLT2011]
MPCTAILLSSTTLPLKTWVSCAETFMADDSTNSRKKYRKLFINFTKF